MTYPLRTNWAATGDPFTAADMDTASTLVNTEWTLLQTVSAVASARVMVNAETLTIASGTVTTIAGTTVDGVSVAVNDRILIANAPASTGAAGGTTLSTQPGNGLYIVTAVATNISVARLPIMSATGPAASPAGLLVSVIAGTFATLGYMVTSPASYPSAFTYGTTAIGFTQISISPTGTQTLTNKRITKRVGATASSATPAINTDNYDAYKITALTADIAGWTITGTPTDFDEFWLSVTASGADRYILWPSQFAESGSAKLPAVIPSGKTVRLKFVYDATASKWQLMAIDTIGY